MHVTNIRLTIPQIAGNAEGTGILTDFRPGYSYDNGKCTDTQTHVKYEVVFPDNNYEKVMVKVQGTKPIIPEEQLEAQRGKIKVRFKNLTGKFYRNNSGEYALSCNADGIEVIA